MSQEAMFVNSNSKTIVKHHLLIHVVSESWHSKDSCNVQVIDIFNKCVPTQDVTSHV